MKLPTKKQIEFYLAGHGWKGEVKQPQAPKPQVMWQKKGVPWPIFTPLYEPFLDEDVLEVIRVCAIAEGERPEADVRRDMAEKWSEGMMPTLDNLKKNGLVRVRKNPPKEYGWDRTENWKDFQFYWRWHDTRKNPETGYYTDKISGIGLFIVTGETVDSEWVTEMLDSGDEIGYPMTPNLDHQELCEILAKQLLWLHKKGWK